MALLSNINDKFAVDSTGAIQFNGQVGTSGYVLKSNANAAPTWVDPSTVIGGPYLPLTGGTLTGALAGTSATFAGNVDLGDSSNISMSAGSAGQLQVKGSGYTGAIALDATAMYIYHNSSLRDLVLGTNETARLTIDGSTGNATFAGIVTVNGTYLTLGGEGYIRSDDSGYLHFQGGTTGTRFFNNANNTALFTILNNGNATFAGEVTISQETQYLNFKKTSTADVLVSMVSETDAGSGGKLRILTKRNGDTAINALTIDDNQNVGIGTTSPTSKLHLRDPGTNSDVGIKIGNDSRDWNLKVMGSVSDSLQFFTHDNSNVMTILPSGNVGIGTTNPGRGLTIDKSNEFASLEIIKNNTGNQIVYLGTGSSGASDLGILQLKDNNTIAVQLYAGGDSWLNGGNVGIGVTSPAEKLDVVEAIRIQAQSGGTNNATLVLTARNGGAYGNSLIARSDIQSTTDGTAYGSDLLFKTTDSSNTRAERMRIESDGDILSYGNLTMTKATPFIVLSNTAETESGITFVDSADPGQSAKITYDSGSSNALKFYNNSTNERMRITSAGDVLIGTTGTQSAGKLQMDSGASENGGILDMASGGNYRYYTRVCRNATTAGSAGYWHIKTNIPVNSNVMFLAKFYGYIYGSSGILDLQHSGYAYSGTNSVINQGTTNNGTNVNASSAIYISSSGSKVTFRIAFGSGANFSTYYCGVTMDMAFLNPNGRSHNLEIEAQGFSQNTTLY